MDEPKSTTPTSLAEMRQIENEVVFRKANEQVQKSLAKLKAMAVQDGHRTLVPDGSMELHFCCECSDENCRERIVMSLDAYRSVHNDRSYFIVLPGHETVAIEKVIAKSAKYSVVEKFITPSEKATTLNTTTVNNAKD